MHAHPNIFNFKLEKFFLVNKKFFLKLVNFKLI